MKRAIQIVCMAAIVAGLGSAASAVDIETVPVGNIGNSADGAGYGAVDYTYNIGKYEVTAGQYADFLNAVAATDTYGLYNTSMGLNEYGCRIQRSGLSGGYTYSVAPDWAKRPVNYVSWGDAARFANWLHNGQPTGAQNDSTTEDGAYHLNGATGIADLQAVSRESDWKWAIPNEDEWCKAAYHQNDGVTGNYFKYPTSSDIAPSNDLIDPDPGNNASYKISDSDWTIGDPYYRTEVGDFENSDSPYGTFDQGGNVWEWIEDPYDRDSRVRRGGCYGCPGGWLEASTRNSNSPDGQRFHIGFRVAELPEPATLGMLALGGLAALRRRSR